MKCITLSKGYEAIVDDEDYENVAKYKWSFSHGYAVRTKDKKRIYLHRYITKAPKGKLVDHINGDGLNCTRANMRLCTQSQNLLNRGKQKNNTSGYKGVCWAKNERKWIAHIQMDGKRKTLGYCATKLDAAKMYNEYALQSKFVKLNEVNV